MTTNTQLIKTLLSLPTTIPALIFIALIALYIYRVLLDPLKDVPGPFLARFIRLWEIYKHSQGKFEKVNIELHRKYGPVVRIAPGRYSIDDRIAVKKIYGHGSKFTKARFYHAFGSFTDPKRANLFQDQNEIQHAQNRRKVASLYSMSTLVSYEPFVNKCTSTLLEKFTLFAASNTIIDIPTWTQFYAFDVIGEITVGRSFDMLTRGSDKDGILSQIHFVNAYGSFVGLVPEWNDWIRWITDGLGVGKVSSGLIKFITTQLDDRRSGKTTSDREDFLSKLLALQRDGTRGIDDHRVYDAVGSNIGAGSDTTGLSLAAVIYYVEKNPDCKRKLREEIDEMDRAGRLSDRVTFKEAQEMEYLQCIIKEALRMHPATGQIMPRLVPKGGTEVCGRYFPAGTEVGTNSWVLHANTGIFGEDAHLFRPERWLGEKEEVSIMNENMFAFGAGARTCIGKNISLLEMTKVIPQIYRRFELEMVDKEWRTENRWFVKQHFDCRIKSRA